jgi:hypothetical protein
MTKAARPGAGVSEHHKSCGTFVPAGGNIGALGFFTDGGKFALTHGALKPKIIFPGRNLGFKPRRLADMQLAILLLLILGERREKSLPRKIVGQGAPAPA